MEKTSASNVLNFFDHESLVKAVKEIVYQLQCPEAKNWNFLLLLLQKLNEQKVNFDIRSIFFVSRECLARRETNRNARIVAEVLNQLCYHPNIDQIKNEFVQLLNDLQSSIIHHFKSMQKVQEPLYEYGTATVALSLILSSSIKQGFIVDSEVLVDIIAMMVKSKNEICIIEALSNILPHVLSLNTKSWDVIYEVVKDLFEDDNEDYKTTNHLGYTALCAMAGLVFLKDAPRCILLEPWFLKGIRSGLSNPVALNRKRSQYLLKRYVDTGSKNNNLLNPNTFYDIFLLLETLEEKQTHLIKPVLARLEALNEQVLVHKQADPSWLMAVYCRIISHENLQVVKWGIHRICKLDLSVYADSIGEDDLFHGQFLQSLNHVTFYVREADDAKTLPPLGRDLCTFLQNAARMPAPKSFFRRLLRGASLVSWNSVALLHFSLALSSVAPRPVLDFDSLRTLLEFLRSALHTQHPFLRGAVQGFLLESARNLVQVSEENLQWICLILAALNPRECYVRHSRLYSDTADWLRLQFTEQQLTDLAAKMIRSYLNDQQDDSGYLIDSKSIGRFVVLALDALKSGDRFLGQLHSTLTPLDSCHSRPYADRASVAKRIELVVAVMRELGKDSADDTRSAITRSLSPLVESVVEWALNEVLESADYANVVRCLDVLETVLETAEFRRTTELVIPRVQQKAFDLFLDSKILNQFKGASLLLILDTDDPSVIRRVLEHGLHCKPQSRAADSPELDVSFGTFASEYFAKIWRLIRRSLSSPLVVPGQLVEEAVCALDIAGSDAIPGILTCLTGLLPKVADADALLCRSTLQVCWNLCFEYRRTDRFWNLIEHFHGMAFQPLLIGHPDIRPDIFALLKRLRDQGENVLGLLNLAARNVVDAWTTGTFPVVDHLSVQFVVDLVTFGSVHRRDEIVEYETCAYVRSLGDRTPVNIHLQSDEAADAQVRFQGLRFLLWLDGCDPHVAMAAAVCDALLALDRSMASSKSRHFASSHAHRCKHRLWTALTVVQNSLVTFQPCRMEAILQCALTGLVEDNPQPSVRFLQEWSVISILLRVPQLHHHFWRSMDAAVEQRAGSMVSFLAISGHTVRCLKESPHFESFARQALPRIVPWAMAQHFTPRLYGCVVLDMVWNACLEEASTETLVREYATVRSILRTSPEMPNARRNVEKLAQDFYLSVFHPLDHLTLETLAYHLPRLAHLAADEWFPTEWFEQLSRTSIPVRNADGTLGQCHPAEWVARAAGGAASSSMDDGAESGASGNVQKKVTPWKMMLPDVDCLAMSSVTNKKKVNTSGSDFLVIASLVDRVPNLGGLCRTCEVLGVKELVISNLRVTEEKDFASLSVSAEKWLTVTEVKPFQLLEYIQHLKREGYRIVGAEQTADSVPLDRFKFPKKSALLLGNEKAGIPVELIQHLDVCVEVPQEGIIRSMNVHVTGAIFVWEYVRQALVHHQ